MNKHLKKIQIKIDAREKSLISLMQNKIQENDFLSLSIENLCLGDILFIDEINNRELLIVERKSLSDLAASIKDGRYNEQSYRLEGYPIHNHNIVYLVEGNANVRPDKLTLYSSMFSINYRKGFSIWRTISLDETAAYIYNCGKYLTKMECLDGYYSNINMNITPNTNSNTDTNTNTNTQPDTSLSTHKNVSGNEYVNVIKPIKKENVTPENIGEIIALSNTWCGNSSSYCYHERI